MTKTKREFKSGDRIVVEYELVEDKGGGNWVIKVGHGSTTFTCILNERFFSHAPVPDFKPGDPVGCTYADGKNAGPHRFAYVDPDNGEFICYDENNFYFSFPKIKEIPKKEKKK